ncbi:MAG: type VI secretion system ImpA family N-terminal domain-containing protein [Novosphingobium sp.]|nr:type VI secretion system ImpA family N-terminal domain-containing protein [Novosphingobium sp.]
MDIAALSRPVSEELPAGEDLSYSGERAMIEQAFDLETVENADPVNWREIVKLIEAQAAETRDAWLPVYLMRASARQGDLDKVNAGAELLVGLLEELWPDLHPTVEEYGFQGRKAPCDSLVGHREFLIPFRRMGIVVHQRLGSFSAEDIEGFFENRDGAQNIGAFRAAVEDLGPDHFTDLVAQLDRLRSSIERVDAILVEHAEGGETGTNFENLYLALAGLRKAIVHFSGIENVPAQTDEGATGEVGEPATGGSGSARATPFSGSVTSREDVARALDLVVEYYRVHEPGSPIPVALKRVRNWVYLDFMQLLEDIVPGGLNDAKRVLGSEGKSPAAAAPVAAPPPVAESQPPASSSSGSDW